MVLVVRLEVQHIPRLPKIRNKLSVIFWVGWCIFVCAAIVLDHKTQCMCCSLVYPRLFQHQFNRD